MKLLLSLVLAMLCFLQSVVANDDDITLYAAPLSENQSYLRIFEGGTLSNYAAYDLSKIKDLTKETNLSEGQYYTFISGENSLIILDDKVENKTKAVLAFYNISDAENLSLKADGNVNVFNHISSYSMVSREINASKISLQTYDGNNILDTIESVIIERQNHYSVLYDGNEMHFFQADIEK